MKTKPHQPKQHPGLVYIGPLGRYTAFCNRDGFIELYKTTSYYKGNKEYPTNLNRIVTNARDLEGARKFLAALTAKPRAASVSESLKHVGDLFGAQVVSK